jgi:hypothetical protein
MKALTKAQRAQLFAMFSGRCAYCGEKLGSRWHADHVEPVGRQNCWVQGGRGQRGFFKPTGKLDYPERDHFGNLVPACHRCNIDKWAHPLESWRAALEESHARLERNYSTYRHALRFGLIKPIPAKVVFFFELPRRRIDPGAVRALHPNQERPQ